MATSRFQKGQIIYLCSLMVMVFIFLSYLSINQLQKSNRILIMGEEVESQHLISQQVFKTDVDFFGYELNNRDFYKEGKSIYLQRHDSLVKHFHSLFKPSTESKGINNDSTQSLLDRYDLAFKNIVDKIRFRGYEDFGVEGNLRSYAHELENGKLISSVDLLMLRRHEKDYLLRWNSIYIKKSDDLIEKLKTSTRSARAIEVLGKYSASFHELVVLTDSIGLETQTNMKGKLNVLAGKLNTRIERLDKQADREVLGSYQKGMTFLSIGIILCTILCISSVIVIIKKM